MHSDHLGSPVAETREDGSVRWTERYTPYGEELTCSALWDNRPGFTGHVDDEDTGLAYMQARYYNPFVGRFYANDPFGFAQGGPGYFNRYWYTAGDPVNAIDPNGMKIVFTGTSSERMKTWIDLMKLNYGPTVR